MPGDLKEFLSHVLVLGAYYYYYYLSNRFYKIKYDFEVL